jgi:hypothetical protein
LRFALTRSQAEFVESHIAFLDHLDANDEKVAWDTRNEHATRYYVLADKITLRGCIMFLRSKRRRPAFDAALEHLAQEGYFGSASGRDFAFEDVAIQCLGRVFDRCQIVKDFARHVAHQQTSRSVDSFVAKLDRNFAELRLPEVRVASATPRTYRSESGSGEQAFLTEMPYNVPYKGSLQMRTGRVT